MPRFLSDEWIADLDAAASSSDALTAAVAGDDESDDADVEALVIQHVVSEVPDRPDGEAAYHLVLGDGPARVAPGRAEDPTVTFTQTYETARSVARGEASAQSAFMAGRLRVGGRMDLLLAHRAALADLDDVFAEVRSRTEW